VPYSIGKGRFLLNDHIGEGGMGQVFLAYDRMIGSDVAIKRMHPRFKGDRLMDALFRTEIEAMRMLRKEGNLGIPRFVAAGEDRGLPFLAMEPIDGYPLNQASPAYLRRYAMPIMDQLCQTLSQVHGMGIVHRDLKPENILVHRTSARWVRVRLIDFGIAKVPGIDCPFSADAIFGTATYLPPERISDSSSEDHRGDIFSLGVMMCELLTGKVPRRIFMRNSLLPVFGHYNSELLKGVHPGIADILKRAMDDNSSRRFGSVDEIRYAFNSLVTRLGRSVLSSELPPTLDLRISSKDRVVGDPIGYMKTEKDDQSEKEG
jgi:serine/threonine protein kinase